ncbi:hypothetical protein KC340_g15102 [Hortaea werneckii]|nr:hypothetical protein KC342_g15477 [Hortaea werneckii]KAI7063547.1 hypothetical protein KC339_g16259 [Hortaea werneckii]KAI7216600.1 hypothetical protein KC365_g13203 [Hortaea werneckii]KAI7297128.1 hypothetical protein KC340_g15102 [Hortaea werneckii]KAI7383609.1 hypothetical protein KC328_g11198 [Hortaea werneckii]
MQTQISYNTSMLEANRRHASDLEQAVGLLRADMNGIVNALNATRAELQARPLHQDNARHDTGDLEVLAAQVATIGNKASEVDGLKMQIDLLKNRLRRFEDYGSPPSSHQNPRSPSARRDQYQSDAAAQQPPAPQPHHQLPSLRAATMMSPSMERTPTMPVPPTLASQSSSGFLAPDARSNEPTPSQHNATSFRPGEPLPPPSAMSGWRPAESHPPSGLPPPPPPAQAQSFRAYTNEPEPEGKGWAAVNASQVAKRPVDEMTRSPLEHSASAPGSPKRPKLAPIMPRSHYSEEGYAGPLSNIQPPEALAGREGGLYARPRAPSDPPQPQVHGHPGPTASTSGAFRFINTQQPHPQEPWRSESVVTQPSGRGRGGRRGRGRGRGGRGGAQLQHHDSEEYSTATHDEQGSPMGQHDPRGYYDPHHAHSTALPGVVPGSDRAYLPATPEQSQEGIPVHVEIANSGSGKRSRTKPIRNAEGILIRKDGRPDMRSVSSANNLRKVHAKKEAERAELGGRTPTSARSLAPAQSASMSEEEEDQGRLGTPASGDSPSHSGERTVHEGRDEADSKAFLSGVEAADEDNGTSESLPRRDGPASAEEVDSKAQAAQEIAAARDADHPMVPEEEQPASAPGHETSNAEAEDRKEETTASSHPEPHQQTETTGTAKIGLDSHAPTPRELDESSSHTATAAEQTATVSASAAAA